MLIHMLKKISVIVSFLLLTSLPVFAADTRVAELRTGSYQTYLLQAIHQSFNLDENAADVLLKKAVDLEPDNATGYALEAMLHLFAYEMCFTLEQRQKEKEAILYYSEEALVRGEKRIARYPKDSQAHLAMALAKIAKVYWAIKEKRYWIMAQETANVWGYLETAKAANPDNHDVDFLMGLLHYHIDHYRGLAGFLSSWLITEGNRLKGLQEIQTAVQKGYLLREIAQVQQAAIYQYYEKQPSKALPILQDLRKKYPDNYTFYFSQGLALLELGRFAEAESVAADIEEKIRAATDPYVPQLQPRYYHLMGRIHFGRGEYGRSESYFHKAIQDRSFYNFRTSARSLLYLGMIHDIRQERKYAEDYYKRALKVEGVDSLTQIEAKDYLKKPYKVNGR
jgi:hypothetical protein